MDGQLCHLVRGKDQGRHSCPVPGLSLDSMSSVLSSAPVHLPQAPIHLLCASWTLHGAQYYLKICMISQLVKNPPAMQETPVQFLGQVDLLEKG